MKVFSKKTFFCILLLTTVFATQGSSQQAPTRKVSYRCDGKATLVVSYVADTAVFWHAGKKRNLKKISNEEGEVRYRENFYEWQVRGKEASLVNVGTYYFIFSKCISK